MDDLISTSRCGVPHYHLVALTAWDYRDLGEEYLDGRA